MWGAKFTDGEGGSDLLRYTMNPKFSFSFEEGSGDKSLTLLQLWRIDPKQNDAAMSTTRRGKNRPRNRGASRRLLAEHPYVRHFTKSESGLGRQAS